MPRCTLCKKPLRSATTDYPLNVGDKTVTVKIPAQRCTGCGDVFTSFDDMQRAALAVAEAVILSGQRTGASFRFLRKTLGLRANELAEKLDTTPETVSRWERGKRPLDMRTWTSLAFLLVGAINRHSRSREQLDAAAVFDAAKKPTPLPLRIKLAS